MPHCRRPRARCAGPAGCNPGQANLGKHTALLARGGQLGPFPVLADLGEARTPRLVRVVARTW